MKSVQMNGYIQMVKNKYYHRIIPFFVTAELFL